MIAALAVVLYANTLGHGYALDDGIVIVDNKYTQAGLAGLPQILTQDYLQGFLGAESNPMPGGRYRPLSLITFAFETAVFGRGHPSVSHGINVLLYALCCALFYRVASDLLAQRRPAAGGDWLSLPLAAALLFTVHPLHTEVVANIKSRDEILALGFGLASISLALRAADRGTRAPAVGAALCFFLALVSKESSIPFLAVVPLSIWFFRADSRAAIARVLPGLAIAACVYLAIRAIVLAGPLVHDEELLNDPFLGSTTADTYATIFYTLGRYALLVVWPHPLTHDYAPFHIAIQSWRDAGPWLGLAVYLGLAGLALSGLRTRSVPAYAAAWYLATLSVASNLLITTGTFMAERFLFTPLSGALLGLAWAPRAAVERWVPPLRRTAPWRALVLGAAAALAALTVLRNPAWKDSWTLYSTDIATSPQSALLNANLAGMILSRANETADPAERARLEQDAMAHVDTALRIHPRYRNALDILATAHKRRGEWDGAIAALERLIAIDPRRYNAAFNLGTILLEHRPDRLADAVRYLEQAVELRPRDADAHANLGVAYYQSGDAVRAIDSFERAVALAPDRADHRANLDALRAEAAEVKAR
jgi:tetratricopeptide (TPR) repeat protein